MKLFFNIVIIFFTPYFCFCQIDYCSYNTGNISTNYYKFLQGTYNNDNQIEKIIYDITSTIGLEKNFVYVNSPGINNCVALNYEGFRYILYH